MGEMVSRRSFLQGGAVVGGSMVVGGSIISASALTTPPSQVARVTLAVARAGAIFPAPFPSFGEVGTAASRATMLRLSVRYAELDPDRRMSVEAGCHDIELTVNLGSRTSLLRGLGERYARSGARGRQRVDAVATLALATISSRFAADDDNAAQLWLAGLVGAPAGGGRRGLIRLVPGD